MGGLHQWEVDDYANMSQEVHQNDATMGISGFKTLGVCVRVDDGPVKFAGILPIMDPPRHDTKLTVARIKEANVAVKMITGDHHNIGIAVHGATDAAKSAGDIVLTKDGLSPIYTAIQISRRIFKRLKSYVIYRICITVQVVFFLASLALFYNLRFRALYIILLALFHDLQIVTIAYDNQVAGVKPETPTVVGLLAQSWTMGILMFIQTMVLVNYGHLFLSDEFNAGYTKSMDPGNAGKEMDRYVETTIFLQISNSSAILILSART